MSNDSSAATQTLGEGTSESQSPINSAPIALVEESPLKDNEAALEVLTIFERLKIMLPELETPQGTKSLKDFVIQ